MEICAVLWSNVEQKCVGNRVYSFQLDGNKWKGMMYFSTTLTGSDGRIKNIHSKSQIYIKSHPETKMN